VNDGALLFLQHMLAKMRAPQDGGSRLAIVFNGSPLFTGDAGGGESEIRRWIIENDWLEAIVALPEQLFYNTGISTYLWVLTNRKDSGAGGADSRKGKVQLIDARPFWVQMEKSLGNKRRRIGDPSDKEKDPDHIGELTKIFGDFCDGQTRTFTEEDPITHQPIQRQRVVSKIFDNDDFGYYKITVERPLRLNFLASAERIAQLDDESGFKNLATSAKKDPAVREKEIEGGKERQKEIRAFVRTLGSKLWKDRKAFLNHLRQSAKSADKDPRLSASELKAVLAALGERDDTAEICRDRDGQPEPDADLRDTETVPLKESIEAYSKREVLPHVPDAWIDPTKTKVGYEIPLNRHFYRYEPPRPLEVIETDIKRLEDDIMKMLREVTA
jgi:type I restriction enzyme M protein